MALSANTPREVRNVNGLVYGDLIVASSSVLYVGALCCANSSNQIVPASDSTAILFLGIFMGGLGGNGQSVTGDGTLTGRFWTNIEALIPCAGTVDAADAQKAIYCTDDSQVTDVNTLGPVCGIVTEIEDSTHVWVRLGAPALSAAS